MRAEIFDAPASTRVKQWLAQLGFTTQADLADARLTLIRTIPNVGDKVLRSLVRWAGPGRLETDWHREQALDEIRIRNHIEIQIKFLRARGYSVTKKENDHDRASHPSH